MLGAVDQDFYYRCLHPAARHVVQDDFLRQRFMTNLLMIPSLLLLLILRSAFHESPSGIDIPWFLGWFWWALMVVEVIGIRWWGDPWVGETTVPVVFSAVAVIATSATLVGFVWLFLAILLAYIRLKDVRVAAVLSALAALSGIVIVLIQGEYSRPNVFRIALALFVLQVLAFLRRIASVRVSEKARQSAVLLGDIIEGLAQGVVVQNASGVVTHYNRRVVSLLNVVPEHVQREPEVLDIRRDASSLGMWVEHGHFRTLAGIDLQVDSQKDSDGGVVTTFTDISQLQQARDSAVAIAGEKSRLLLEVGREFRAPVHALLALLREVAGTDSDIRRRAAISRGEVLGQRLLAFGSGRTEELSILTGTGEPVALSLELEAFLRDIGSQLSSLPDASRVEILFEVDPRLPTVLRLDALRLRQVLIGLLSNAVRLAVGGTVVLRVERLENLDEAGKVAMRWSVQDDGPGIPPSQWPVIFEGSGRADEVLGLGLPVSQYIARSLGTEIKVASVPGFGATFSFDMLVEQEAFADEFGESLRQEMTEGTRVLLVATATQASEHALTLLQSLGYTVESASAELVPTKLLAAADRGQPYAVTVLDTADFPEGIETFLTTVRSTGATAVITRTVAMVGQLSELQMTLPASAQGLVDSLLLKPYTPRMLVEAVSGAVFTGDSNAPLVNPPGSLSGMRVLLAESHPVSRQVVGRLLLRAGCQLFAVETPEALRAQVELRAGAFDVVIADADLCGQVGFATLRVSRSEQVAVPLPRPPLVCMTASKGPLMLHGLSDGEVRQVLQKPVDPAKLLEVLEGLGSAVGTAAA